MTPANVHDSQVFEDLLDTETTDNQGRKRPVYADSAYRSEKHEQRLKNSRWTARSTRKAAAPHR